MVILLSLALAACAPLPPTTREPAHTEIQSDHYGDPMPEPPPLPEASACCGSGCDPCIFDLHDRAMERYRQALQAWRARHPEAPSQAD